MVNHKTLEFGRISVMGQEGEIKLKLELVALINKELDQTHLRHRKGWLKRKSSTFNFKGKKRPEFLGLSKQGKRLILEIHPSNTVWVLRHRNRSCENQECLESEQAVNNSGLETDREDNSSTCSDSGHVEKRRKMNHLAIQKAKQYLNQMNKDNVKLTESIVTLEEQSLQKLSEISSAFPTLASFFMNIKISKVV